MLHLSEIINRPIRDRQGTEMAHVRDVVATLPPDGTSGPVWPRLHGLVAGTGRGGSGFFVPVTRLGRLDGARITLTVTDLSAMGAFAGIAGAMGVTSSKETASGYEKVGKVNGRMTTEEWNRESKSGKYGVLVADRFMVNAEGSGTSIDDLKAAVAAVGPDRLEGLAKG